MNAIKLNVGMHGEFRLVVNQGTERERDYGWFDNLILDQGLEAIGTNPQGNESLIRYCRLGTGTSAPSNSQTVLDTQVAASGSNPTGSSNSNEGTPLYRVTQTVYWTFAQGAVVGNISEIGVGWGSIGATLFSRALILDGSGNPTTITLVSIDQLTVYYRLRFTPPITDGTGTLTLSGTGYTYTLRIADINIFMVGSGSSTIGRLYPDFFRANTAYTRSHPAGCTIGAITGYPSGSGVGCGSYSTTNTAYTPGSYTLRTVMSFGIGDLNAAGGIGGLVVQSYGWMIIQAVFGTTIPKNNTKTMSFGIDYSWSRGP